ncbi:hypothetical protein [Actinomadura sp. 3N508]|uniref:hypothetical protein n=1 Tax=Actinomadura sp. 3N508 TaxID=3375153 RepID=UPI00379D2721
MIGPDGAPCAPSLQVAEALAGDAPDPYAQLPGPADLALILPHAARLAARGDLATCPAACSPAPSPAATPPPPRAGWPEAWRNLLRTHPHPDTTFAAHGIHTTPE